MDIKDDEPIIHIEDYNEALQEIMNFCNESIEIYNGDKLFDYSDEEKEIFKLIYEICRSKIRLLL